MGSGPIRKGECEPEGMNRRGVYMGPQNDATGFEGLLDSLVKVIFLRIVPQQNSLYTNQSISSGSVSRGK